MARWGMLSLPTWAAWIEIQKEAAEKLDISRSLPTWAAWIEIKNELNRLKDKLGRCPLGQRGLKYILRAFRFRRVLVAAHLGSVD